MQWRVTQATPLPSWSPTTLVIWCIATNADIVTLVGGTNAHSSTWAKVRMVAAMSTIFFIRCVCTFRLPLSRHHESWRIRRSPWDACSHCKVSTIEGWSSTFHSLHMRHPWVTLVAAKSSWIIQLFAHLLLPEDRWEECRRFVWRWVKVSQKKWYIWCKRMWVSAPLEYCESECSGAATFER